MALLLSISFLNPCPDCDEPYCSHGERVRVQELYCYHGARPLAEGRYPTHKVELPGDATHASAGWFKRDGKLPICPEHRQDGDVPYGEPTP
jgi:hypothetical protein